ncbi:conserved hypothetical protein [Gammaproteobacteria bacterium]
MTIDFRITVEGFDRLKFDKKQLRAAIRKGGTVVRKEARRLIASRAVSLPGQFPGYQSGAMSRSIKVKIGSRGGYALIKPYKTSEMGENFYPAYLIYGTSRGLKPRKDFMVSALDNKQTEIRGAISAALAAGLGVA